MGYNVRIIESTATIPADNLERAYQAMCALNVTHHDQKSGGSWEQGKQTSRWFAWMDADYPSKCKDAEAVLKEVGFYCDRNRDGSLLIGGYDSKTGQEELFLKAIENMGTGEILWLGEDGDRYVTKFHGDSVVEAQVEVKRLTLDTEIV